MARKSKQGYEDYLNEVGCNFEDCVYICNSSRKNSIKEQSLRNLLNDNRYGYALRKYDPIAFEVGYQEWAT